jgi:hypothetical protein
MEVMKLRYVLDASVLASIVNSDDVEHFSCYSFFRNLHDGDKVVWVVPSLLFFEYQATQSRRYREKGMEGDAFRHAPLYVSNSILYEANRDFLIRPCSQNI